MVTNVYQVTIIPQIDSIFADATPSRFEVKLSSELYEGEIRQELECAIQGALGDFCASIDWTENGIFEANVPDYYLIAEIRILNEMENE